ncbi:MAG TPA: glutathione S-transferase family protein [Phenylobacterium sp.]|uniref:glutathione S-transferase family protein n=1 Tax=Phenylobacterium sp. TaxID=1871053 RepID=UPI002B4942C2|nr:glutathione S-transferase family protein [Phenylobacterium sp.]HKR89430.1 glutathione S-transferase family protein [Phenylobacterium sp.]
MAEELVFYTNPMSRGRIVRWMLEEVGQPYRTQVLDYAESMKSPAYLAINPMGKVPALTHGVTVITEGAAICAYLADAFPQAGLAPPPADPERGPYYRWLFFAAGPLESALTNRRLGVEVSPEQQRMAGYGSYAQVMDALEQTLDGREYLAGGRFSAADLYLGANLDYAMNFGAVEKRPAFEAYVARLRKRPAYVRASEIDNGLVAAQQPA